MDWILLRRLVLLEHLAMLITFVPDAIFLASFSHILCIRSLSVLSYSYEYWCFGYLGCFDRFKAFQIFETYDTFGIFVFYTICFPGIVFWFVNFYCMGMCLWTSFECTWFWWMDHVTSQAINKFNKKPGSLSRVNNYIRTKQCRRTIKALSKS